MKLFRKKTRLVLIIAAVLIVLAGLGYWKRRGIRNTFYRLTGQAVPYRYIEEGKEKFGYYKQVVKTDMDFENTAIILENDAASERIQTSIETEMTLVDQTAQINKQIKAETEAGYTIEEPMVILNPYQISPLTALVIFDTREECGVRFTVKGKTAAADIVGELEPCIHHIIPVVGLYADYENTVEIELLNQDGSVKQSKEILIVTDVLPEILQDIIEPVEVSGESAYDLTMVYGQKTKIPFAYDCMGDVRWFLQRETAGLFPLSNGRIMSQEKTAHVPGPEKPEPTNLYEYDYLGRTFRMYYIPEGNHHEIIEKTPGGNLLLLSSDLPLHCEDKIIEIDRETGVCVDELPLADLFGTTYTNRDDWAHLNTVSYDEKSDSILISARNIESVIKINWTTKQIEWILCDPRFWEDTPFEQYVLTPTDDFIYQFQQHTAYFVGADLDHDANTVEVSMFDNHSTTVRKALLDYYDSPGESYLLVYAVNETDKTVQQIKKIPVVYSSITSAARYEPDSGRMFGMCGWAHKPDGGRYGMTYEFDYEDEKLINQYRIRTSYYRASEMKIDYEELAEIAEIPENYICGELWQPMAVKSKVSEPEKELTDQLSWKLVGSVLYAHTSDHRISQIIFKGDNNTYVYDLSKIHLHEQEYLSYSENIPIPLGNLNEDTYQIWCMYEDEFYQSGQSFSIE